MKKLLLALFVLWAAPTFAQTHSVTLSCDTLPGGSVSANIYKNGSLLSNVPAAPPCGYVDSAVNAGETDTYYATALTTTAESGPSNVVTAVIPGGITPPPPPPGCAGETLFPLTIVPTTTATIPTDVNELGVKVTIASAGSITCVRFYKLPSDTHTTHPYALWSSSGAKLTSGTFTAETASGWQVATLATPLAITAAQSITFSVNTGTGGHYADTQGFFTSATTTGDLKTPASAGVYNPGATQTFPTQVFNASNYWRDIYFTAANAPPSPITVAIVPTGASVVTGGTALFSFSIKNDASNAGVTWSANAPNGVFTAPSTPGTATVTVTSVSDPTKSATASVTIVAPPLTLICASNVCTVGGGISGQSGTIQLTPGGPVATWRLP